MLAKRLENVCKGKEIMAEPRSIVETYFFNDADKLYGEKLPYILKRTLVSKIIHLMSLV